MRQFAKLYLDLLEEDFTTTEIVAYTLLSDRMESSVKRREFFDKKELASYIIFTREELSAKLHVSSRTVTNIFKKLADRGLIVIKRQFNKANRIFIPGFESIEATPVTEKPLEPADSNESENTAVPNEQNLQVNYPDSNHFNQTDNTSNTANDNFAGVIDPKTTKKIQERKTELDILADSLHTQAGIPADAVQILKDLSYGDPKRLHEYGSLIFKAKSAELKRAIDVPDGYASLRFETNHLLSESFAENIKRILFMAQKKLNHNWQGYAVTSLRNYFGTVANAYLTQNAEKALGNSVY